MEGTHPARRLEEIVRDGFEGEGIVASVAVPNAVSEVEHAAQGVAPLVIEREVAERRMVGDVAFVKGRAKEERLTQRPATEGMMNRRM